MIRLLKQFTVETKAAIAFEYSIGLIFFMTFLLISIDLMMIIGQWADVQRANALMAELIKNRVQPIVVAGYNGTPTQGTNYVSTYCKLLLFSKLCDNIVMYVATSDSNSNEKYIPGLSDFVFCYNKNMSCDYSNNLYPLTNKSNVVLILTNAKPYRITSFNYITNTIFGKNISSTNIVSLNR
jgi:hypothetical protein